MKPPQGAPRPAPQDDSPFAVLVRTLDVRHRADFSDSFAGFVRASDSLVALERLHEQVRARNGELQSRGIVLGSFGVDVRRNRYRFAVVDLTPEKAAILTATFGADHVGADHVEVVQGGLWRPL